MTTQRFNVSNKFQQGFYITESSAKKAFSQLNRKRNNKDCYLIIYEFELTNKKEII